MMERITLTRDGMELSARIGGDGPLVILLHGFPDTWESWHQQWPVLIKAGYRCLVPTMRGYEPGSARLDKAHYGIDRVAADVIAWMDHLNVSQAHLVGHDWGAATAYLATAKFPERFISLSTLAIPHISGLKTGLRQHPIQLLNSSYMALFQLKGFSEWCCRRKDFGFIEFLWRRWSPDLQDSETRRRALAAVKKTLSDPHVLTATLNYYRAFFSPSNRPDPATMASPLQIPTQMLAGANDGCMDVRLYGCMDPGSFSAEWEVVRFPNAGHFMQLEVPDQVNERLLQWLQKFSAVEVEKPEIQHST